MPDIYVHDFEVRYDLTPFLLIGLAVVVGLVGWLIWRKRRKT